LALPQWRRQHRLDAPFIACRITVPAPHLCRLSDEDLEHLARTIDDAETVAIFGGERCRDARDDVIRLATKLETPVGYSPGRQWLEYDNPNAAGMTGSR
jgi:pyruvate dehydrogenase (quinone)